MTNKQFKNICEKVLIAKAHLQTLEEIHLEAEKQFIIDNKIVNSDGKVPQRFFMMDNETEMEKQCIMFEEIPENQQQWLEIIEAKRILKEAEQNLIDYALNIIPLPQKEKQVLENGAKTNYTIRQKIIDLVMKLDVSTLPKEIANTL